MKENEKLIDGLPYRRSGQRQRALHGRLGIIVATLGFLAGAIAIVYVSNALDYLDVYILRQTYLGVFLSLFLVIIFLLFPATKSAPFHRISWYDILLIFFAVAGPLYYAIEYPSNLTRMDSGLFTPFELVLTLVSILTILEAARRVVGLLMPAVAMFFFIQAMMCNYFPGVLHGRGYDLARVTTQAYLSHFGVFGVAFNIAATIVIIFILFGEFLRVTGGGDFMNNLAFSLLGHMRGGPAKASVVASAIFGTISGMTTANIATTGAFTIPLMKKTGYRDFFAAAVETVASNGGQIMPPVMGAVAFIMAELLEMPYYKVCLAALIPAVLYYICVFTMVDVEARRLSLTGIPRAELPALKNVLQKDWEFVIPVVALIFLIVKLSYSPERSALYGIAVIILVTLFRKRDRLSARTVVATIRDGTIASAVAVIVCAAAGIIMGSLGLTGIGVKISGTILDYSGGNLPLVLIFSALACFILGMGVGSIASYLMVAVLIAPALVDMGVAQIAAHLFVFYFAITAFITPPVAIGAYVASGIAGSDPWKTGWQAARLAILSFIIPFIFVYDPALVMIGSPIHVFLAGVTAAGAAVLMGYGMSGYLLTKLKWWQIGLLFVGSLVLLIPGVLTDVLGIILVAPVLIQQFRFERGRRAYKSPR